jgi:hypothetical protein
MDSTLSSISVRVGEMQGREFSITDKVLLKEDWQCFILQKNKEISQIALKQESRLTNIKSSGKRGKISFPKL